MYLEFSYIQVPLETSVSHASTLPRVWQLFPDKGEAETS